MAALSSRCSPSRLRDDGVPWDAACRTPDTALAECQRRRYRPCLALPKGAKRRGTFEGSLAIRGHPARTLRTQNFLANKGKKHKKHPRWHCVRRAGGYTQASSLVRQQLDSHYSSAEHLSLRQGLGAETEGFWVREHPAQTGGDATKIPPKPVTTRHNTPKKKKWTTSSSGRSS